MSPPWRAAAAQTGRLTSKISTDTAAIATQVLEKPNDSVSVPPIASRARKEIAPMAVCDTRPADHRRALFAVKRSAKSSSVWLATQRL